MPYCVYKHEPDAYTLIGDVFHAYIFIDEGSIVLIYFIMINKIRLFISGYKNP